MRNSLRLTATIALSPFLYAAPAFAEVADKMPAESSLWTSFATAIVISAVIALVGRRFRRVGLVLAVLTGLVGALFFFVALDDAFGPVGRAVRVELGLRYSVIHTLWPFPYLTSAGYLFGVHLDSASGPVTD